MAFEPHHRNDANWASFQRISDTDSLYPPITAQLIDAQEFAGSTVTTTSIKPRFARLVLGDAKRWTTSACVSSVPISDGALTLAGADPTRKGYSIMNTGSNEVFIYEGVNNATALAMCVAILQPGETFISRSPIWTGKVSAICRESESSTIKFANSIDDCNATTTTSTPTTTTTSTTTTTTTPCPLPLVEGTGFNYSVLSNDGNATAHVNWVEAQATGTAVSALSVSETYYVSGEFKGGRGDSHELDEYEIVFHAASAADGTPTVGEGNYYGGGGSPNATPSWTDSCIVNNLSGYQTLEVELGPITQETLSFPPGSYPIEVWIGIHDQGDSGVDRMPQIYWKNVKAYQKCVQTTTTTTSTTTTSTTTTTTSTSTTTTTTPGACDPYGFNTVLDIRSNDTHGSYTITDSSIHNHTISHRTSWPTLVSHTSANTVDGDTSLDFGLGGTGYTAIRVTTGTEELDLGGSDCTLEMWVYRTGGGNYEGLINQDDYSNPNCKFQWRINTGYLGMTTADQMQFLIFRDSTRSAISWMVADVAPINTRWQHLAVTCKDNIWHCWVDGLSSATATMSGIMWSGPHPTNPGLYPEYTPTGIGWNHGWYSNYHFRGYMDNVRITKGVARYTANFATELSTMSAGISGQDYPFYSNQVCSTTTTTTSTTTTTTTTSTTTTTTSTTTTTTSTTTTTTSTSTSTTTTGYGGGGGSDYVAISTSAAVVVDQYDSDYKYFVIDSTTSSAFEVTDAGDSAGSDTIEVYLIAGGGGGGSQTSSSNIGTGGGGGAGGFLRDLSYDNGGDLAQVYDVTIGSGGIGGVPNYAYAAAGTDSTLDPDSGATLTAIGGGHAGSYSALTAGDGGSGGGGAYSPSTAGSTDDAEQGNDGGAGYASSPYTCGGGGGAFDAGADGSAGGAGGAGWTDDDGWMDGNSLGFGPVGYFAGGGGGGKGETSYGGDGGGGDGGWLSTDDGADGEVNSGGGGGGGGKTHGAGNLAADGGQGGSGKLIVRWKYRN